MFQNLEQFAVLLDTFEDNHIVLLTCAAGSLRLLS